MNRREALLVTGAVLAWPQVGQARASARRVRAGAPITLSCPGATAFRFETRRARGQVPVVAGKARFPAPLLPHKDGLATLRCTPLADGEPCGDPVEVLVLAPVVGFGA